jgi:hypothetical protein
MGIIYRYLCSSTITRSDGASMSSSAMPPSSTKRASSSIGSTASRITEQVYKLIPSGKTKDDLSVTCIRSYDMLFNVCDTTCTTFQNQYDFPASTRYYLYGSKRLIMVYSRYFSLFLFVPFRVLYSLVTVKRCGGFD